MSTLTFDISDSRVVQSGKFAFDYMATAGARALSFLGQNGTLDLRATGTACTMKMAVTATGTNYLQASIDGGAFADITSPGSANVYTDTTIFTGLSDTQHTVTIKHNAGAVANSYIQDVNGLTITGAAPALAAPAASAFGAVYTDGGSLLRYVLPEGEVMHAALSGHNCYRLNSIDCAGRFRANPTSIQIFSLLNGSQIRLSQDGVAIGSKITLANTSKWGWTTLATGLDGNSHNYHVSCVNTTSLYWVGLNLIGGDFDTVNPLVQRAAILWHGDSITAGSGIPDSSLAHPWLISQAKGYQCLNLGLSGEKAMAQASGGASTENSHPRLYSPNMYPSLIKYVVLMSGRNDSALPNIGSSNSELRACYVRIMTRLKALHPEATCYGISPLDTTGYATTVRDGMAADMEAAVTAVGAPWQYIRACSSAGQANFTDGALTASTDLSDGTHPNATGYTHIYNFLQSNFAVAPSLFTTTGAGGSII